MQVDENVSQALICATIKESTGSASHSQEAILTKQAMVINKIVSIADRLRANDVDDKDCQFLALLRADISENPSVVQPIKSSLFERMAAIRSRVEAAERSHLLEG